MVKNSPSGDLQVERVDGDDLAVALADADQADVGGSPGRSSEPGSDDATASPLPRAAGPVCSPLYKDAFVRQTYTEPRACAH